MKRPAFTLVELLITAVLFVVVAGYSVVILTSTVSLSDQVERSTGIASQSRQVLDVISQAFSQSARNQPVSILLTNEAGRADDVLIFSVQNTTNTGATDGTSEQRVYCPAIVGTMHRLAMFTVVGNFTIKSPAVECSRTGIAQVFDPAAVVSQPTYITDERTNILRFDAHIIQYNSFTTAPTPPAIRLGLTSLVDTGAAGRTDGSASPITVERVAVRNFPYGLKPFNGLSL